MAQYAAWLLRSLLQSVASSSLFHNDPKGGLPAAGDINAGNKGAEVHTAEGCRHTATGGIEEDYRCLVGCHDVAGDLSQRRGAGRGNGGDGGLQTVGDTDRALGPLHNPANLKGIVECEKIMPVPQVAVTVTSPGATASNTTRRVSPSDDS